MSRTIDDRVVSMEFDNRQFENNVKTSMNTIDNLKKSLNFSGASKGLENIDAASKKVNMTGLSGAIETVGSRFSALEVMAVTALANITNSAVNAGKRMVASFTIEPIKTGLSEYETQINAVQTVLANTESKGTTLDDVNKALDELNLYADKTIYNFTEMTKNIGTFTAAGVDLGTSVSAIKGIANLAAVSGSNSQQASTAMYQLSQALSSGTVKLMDWNSVVNAGMGGQVFQDSLKETARAHNINIDSMIEKEGSFRETLQNGWLTSDILLETLNKFTGDLSEEQLKSMGYTEQQIEGIMKLGQTANDAATKVKTFTQLMDTLKEAAQSGWTQTWEILIGDFEEAKELWTSVSNVFGEIINSASESRNTLLQGWKDAGGRAQVITAIKNVFEGLVSILKSAKESFSQVFPKVTVARLIEITTKITELTKKFKLNFTQTVKLRTAFYNLFSGVKSGIDTIKNILSGLMSVIKPIISAFFEIFPLTDILIGITGIIRKIADGIKDFTAKLKLNDEQASRLKSTFKGIFSILDIGIQIIKGTLSILSKIISGLFSFFGITGSLGDALLQITGHIGDWITGVRDSIKENDLLRNIVTKITAVIENATSKVKAFIAALNEKFVSPGLEGIFGLFSKLWNVLKTVGGKIIEVVKNIASAISEAFRNGGIEGAVSSLNGGILALILLKIKGFISGIKGTFDSAGGIVENIKEILNTTKGCLEEWQKSIQAKTLKTMASALLILAAALFIIATIDPERLTSALLAIGALFGELIGAMALFNKIEFSKGIGKATTNLITISIAILILAAALKKISDLDTGELVIGLIGIFALLEMVVLVSLEMSKIKGKAMKGALNIVIFALAVKILTKSLIEISALNWGELAKGITGIIVILGSLVVAAKIMETDGTKMTKGAGQMLVMSMALTIVALALKSLAKLSWEELAKGMVGIIVVLGSLVAAAKIMASNGNKMVRGSGQILIMAIAIDILMIACNKLAKLSWEELAKGVGGIIVLTAALATAAKILSTDGSQTVKGAGQIFIMAIALNIVAKAVKKISDLNWNELVKGLTGIVVSLAAIVGALAIMSKVNGSIKSAASIFIIAAALLVLAPALKILGSMSWRSVAIGLTAVAGALTIFGLAALILKPLVPTLFGLSVAMLIFGAACSLIGAGLLAVSIALTSLGASIVVLVASIMEAIEEVARGLGEIIVAFCETIAGSAMSIAKAIVAVVEAVCLVILEAAPTITETFFQLLIEILTQLKTYIPQLVNLLVDVIVELFGSLATRIPDIVQAAAPLIQSFFTSLTSELGNINLSGISDIVKSVSEVILAIAIAAKVISTINIAGALYGIAGLAIIIAGLAVILTALGGLAQIKGFEWILSEGTRILGQIGTAIGTFVGNLAGNFMAGLSSGLPELGNNLSAFFDSIKPFLDGVKGIDSSAVEGAKNLGKAVLAITMSDFIHGITSWVTGDSSLTTFGEDLAAFGPYFKKFSDSISGIDGATIESSANAALAVAEFAKKIPNTGGLVGKITGENSITQFAEELTVFGPKLKAYADSVKGLDSGVVENSARAATALAEMAKGLPNSGGVAGWFTGENDLSMFAEELAAFGPKLKEYADSVSGLDAGVVDNSVKAATALSGMAKSLPNQGGVVTWFTGDNKLSVFGEELASFGPYFKQYADSVSGVNSEAVTASANAALSLSELASNLPNSGGLASWFAGDNTFADFAVGLIDFGTAVKGFSDSVAGGIAVESVKSACQAGKALAEMANTIPNQGGVVGWFAGENSIAAFGEEIKDFGSNLKSFSDSVTDVNPENIIAASRAGKALAEMANTIPNEGGVVAWFSGENSMAAFGSNIESFGKNLAAFAFNVGDIIPENVIAAAKAGEALAGMASTIPNEGGVAAWFSGENSISAFGPRIAVFGSNLAAFSDNVKNINVEKVTAAATAGKALAEMADTIPNEGGIKAWFSGESSIATFGDNIKTVGASIADFSDSVVNIVPENVESAARAGKALAEMANTIPNEGGISAWFSGESSMAAFGDNIAEFGSNLKTFSDNVADINPENIISAAQAGKALAEMANTIPNEGGVKAWFAGDNSVAAFGDNIAEFGNDISAFSDNLDGIKISRITAATTAGKSLAEMANTVVDSADLGDFGKSIEKFGTSLSKFSEDIEDIDADNMTSAIDGIKISMESLNEIGCDGIEDFAKAFKDGGSNIKKAISDFVKATEDAIKSKKDSISNALKTMVSEALSSIKNVQMRNSFYSAGSYLVDGFCNGISTNAYKAAVKTRAMANAAKIAAEKALGVESPSKVFYQIGTYAVEGFTNAFSDNTSSSYKAGSEIAKSATTGFSKAISKIQDVIDHGIDDQLTIRPVLDLSNIANGANAINGMFGMTPSIGMLSNIGTISSMMNQNQNGSADDVVSAIKDLGRKLGDSTGDSYTINGITYDDGSNISDAVRTLVRAARVERRI